ncbi:hypothetical protein NQ315_017060 [Exocentrus adspersus]|uniref:Jumonji domain-containing protein 4 n=1 Tax=Exocentrus adspersus TaxID=1586481 RepID=A0AAV8VHG7_9CUCU|nr:hypothetical protein NQ315_017060 [Exocentrus adspersus]
MELEIENPEPHLNIDYDSLNEIPVFDANNLSYNKFFKSFMLPNVPCIIQNVTEQWDSSKLWVQSGKPNLDYLLDKYGDCTVTVYNCNERYYNSQKTHESTFDNYLDYWKKYNHHDDSSNTLPLSYLKDWHLKLLDETDEFYKVPLYFASDWLNEYYTTAHLSDDYRFDTFSCRRFHIVQLVSECLWQETMVAVPSGRRKLLKDGLGNLPYDVAGLEGSVKHFKVVQHPGEAIFVPSGWYHQVTNIEDTISVNHNWVNGCNIKQMWDSMRSGLEKVRLEIEDCIDMDGFEEHCQVMLNAAFGMDYYKFYDFLKCIGLTRTEMIGERRTSQMFFHGYKLGRNHILFDLEAVQRILKEFVGCDDVNNLKYFKDVDTKPCTVLETITRALENASNEGTQNYC